MTTGVNRRLARLELAVAQAAAACQAAADDPRPLAQRQTLLIVHAFERLREALVAARLGHVTAGGDAPVAWTPADATEAVNLLFPDCPNELDYTNSPLAWFCGEAANRFWPAAWRRWGTSDPAVLLAAGLGADDLVELAQLDPDQPAEPGEPHPTLRQSAERFYEAQALDWVLAGYPDDQFPEHCDHAGITRGLMARVRAAHAKDSP